MLGDSDLGVGDPVMCRSEFSLCVHKVSYRELEGRAVGQQLV